MSWAQNAAGLPEWEVVCFRVAWRGERGQGAGMVEIRDIRDQESLEGWLKDQPREVSIWIGQRVAMRVLPIYWESSEASKTAREQDFSVLPLLRYYCLSETALKMPTSEIIAFATSAADATFYSDVGDYPASIAANEAAVNSAYAYDSNANATLASYAAVIKSVKAVTAYFPEFATASGDKIWETLREDCEAINAGRDIDRLKLWAGENLLADVWTQVKAKLSVVALPRSLETTRDSAPVDWSFWVKWYDDALAGNPPNWEMLERIALIDPNEWDKGSEVINPLIAEIVAEFEGEPEAELTPQQALNQNSKAVVAQLEALKTFVEEEIQRIRSPNNITDEEQEQIKTRVVALQSIIDAIRKMIAALADGGLQTANALVVIGEQLPKVIVEAENLAVQDPVVSETIVLMGATVEHLTKRGMPGLVASGIAGTDVAIRSVRKWLKRDKSTN